MVFSATDNNISVISWRSDLLVEETGVPWENHRYVASYWKQHRIDNSLSMNHIVYLFICFYLLLFFSVVMITFMSLNHYKVGTLQQINNKHNFNTNKHNNK